MNPISEKENEEKIPRDEAQKEVENEPLEVEKNPVKAEDQTEDNETKEQPQNVEVAINPSSPAEPVPQPAQPIVSPSKPVRKSRPQGKLVSAMINAFSNRQTLPKNPPEEIDEKVSENIFTPSSETQKEPEVKPEVIPEPEATPDIKSEVPSAHLNMETPKLPSSVPIMTSLDSIEKSKSSSFSVPRPSAQFRSVKRPVIRTKVLKTSSIEKPMSFEGPAMTYADIMAAKEGRQSSNVSNPSASIPSIPSNPLNPSNLPNSSGLQNDPNQNSEVETEVETYGGNENTSDDAESIPISYQEPQDSFHKSSRLQSSPKPSAPSSDLQAKKTSNDFPDSEESSISEVRQEELKKDLTNHSHIPSRSRKPLVKRPSISLDQIPEEKSEASVSEKEVVENYTTKKKRR